MLVSVGEHHVFSEIAFFCRSSSGMKDTTIAIGVDLGTSFPFGDIDGKAGEGLLN